jgi:uncharacterized protein (TIGR00645 family)
MNNPEIESLTERAAIREPSGTAAERVFARAMFASRWLLAPIYVGLIGALLILLLEAGKVLYHLAEAGLGLEHDDAVVAILELIDLSLLANLVLMVMFAGYESFVSRIHTGEDRERLDWMGSLGLGDLKIKLITSLVAISAIRLLEVLMDVENAPDHVLIWTVAVVLTFVVSGLLLVVMEKMLHR